MVRGTTPTFTLTFPESVDLTEAKDVYVSFGSGRRLITKSTEEEGLTVREHEIDVFLDQAETLYFPEGCTVEIQANWTYPGGERAASEKTSVTTGGNLLTEVL